MPSRSKRLVSGLDLPIVLAPMAGGPSTVALATAVCEAGGLGFLAAGYREPHQTREEIHRLRQLTDKPFGVNLFVPGEDRAEEHAVARYLHGLGDDADRYGAELGQPRHDEDHWHQKLEMLRLERPAVVSFAFGCPSATEIEQLQSAGIAAWVTITDPAEIGSAREAGADALVLQGVEAGGHRGGSSDPGRDGLGVLSLLRLAAGSCELPLIAAGGIIDGQGLAAVLCAGASAAQLGTAFMLCEEAGTTVAHRAAIETDTPTVLTRAFTGRTGRGILNRFILDHGEQAPIGYPQIHYATSPLRARAREQEDPDGFNLWAGQTHRLAQAEPAREVVRRIATEASSALRDAERFMSASLRRE